MIFYEPVLFFISLVINSAILFLLVYYIITLTDLECDYLNAQQCCDKLNFWLLPKYVAHCCITFLMGLHFYLLLFFVNLPMCLWLSVQLFKIPQGNLGTYDPAEIHNGGQLRRHLRNVMIHIGYYLLFLFIYIYYFILALMKGGPVTKVNDYDVVTEL